MQAGPKAVIDAQNEAAKLYTTKILMTTKNLPDEAKANHQGFTKATADLTAGWAEYTNEYFKTGLVWKHNGSALGDFKAGAAQAGAGAAAGAAEGKKSVEDRIAAVISRIDRVASKLNKSSDAGGGEPPAVAEHKAFYAGDVQPALAAIEAFPDLKRQAELVRAGFAFEGAVVAATFACAKPSDPDFTKFLGPLTKVITDASAAADNRSPHFNYQQAVSEVLQALGWVAQPGPVAAIQGQIDSANVYFTKILMACKDKPDPEKTNSRTFVNALKALLAALTEYTKEHFKMGLTWKPNGSALSAFKA